MTNIRIMFLGLVVAPTAVAFCAYAGAWGFTIAQLNIQTWAMAYL